MNFFQRIEVISDYATVTVVLRGTVDFAVAYKENLQVWFSRWFSKPGFFLDILMRKSGSLRKYDVILTEPSYLAVFGLLAKLTFGKRWAIDIWDIPFRDLQLTSLTRLKRKLQVMIFAPIFRFADLYIVSIIPDFELEEFSLSKTKMRCFANAIHLDEYEDLTSVEDFDHFTLLVQRSQFFKGFGLDLMLSALEIVRREIDARLLIVGEVMPECREVLDHFGEKESVVETGFVPHDKFLQLALGSHVCVIPYPRSADLEQIHPIKAIEFMALGKAIVATNLAGLRRLIGDAGVLVDRIDASALAEAIISLYKDPNRRKVLGERARRRSRRFDARRKNARIYRELESLVSDR